MKKAIRTKDGFRVTPINRRRACRLMCVECMGWNNSEVDDCNGKMLDGSICALVSYKGMREKQNPTKRNRALRDFCLECMGGSVDLVSKCESKYCPVHPYRIAKTDTSFLFDPDMDDETVLKLTSGV